jgi:hypothetical protein
MDFQAEGFLLPSSLPARRARIEPRYILRAKLRIGSFFGSCVVTHAFFLSSAHRKFQFATQTKLARSGRVAPQGLFAG